MARSPSSLLSRLCCATAVGISLLSSPVFAQTDTRGDAQPDKNTAMSARELRAPKVIFFDVNETLLDLTAMRSSVGEALGGRDDLLPLWFSTMLHHSLVDSTTGRFHTFGEIAQPDYLPYSFFIEGGALAVAMQASLSSQV